MEIIMKNNIESIDSLAHKVYEKIKITRDSCGYNEYFTQEEMLNRAIELQELLQEKLFSF